MNATAELLRSATTPPPLPACLTAFASELCLFFGSALPQKRKSPAEYIYFLVRESAVVYVGRSRDLTTRLTKHRLVRDFDFVVYFLVHRLDASQAERELIHYLDPPENLRSRLTSDTTHIALDYLASRFPALRQGSTACTVL